MKTVAIIQARTGSTRLPGKVLADIGGRSMLARVVRRASRAQRIDAVVVATTNQDSDQALVDAGQRLGVEVFRGSEDDVLDRTYRAAKACGAQAVVRITSDCPLIDPAVVDGVVGAFEAERPDYASNTQDRTFPRGLDTEVMTFEALERAWNEARKPYQRAHVTAYLYQHPETFRVLQVTGEEDFSAHRWTVDTEADLQLVRAIYRRFDDDTFGWRQVLEVLAREPELVALNRHVQQKALEEG